jgi:hypothetical protein
MRRREFLKMPQMMATKRLPESPGYPNLTGAVTTDASQGYNVRMQCFWPASVKGIVFLPCKAVVEKDQSANFGEQLSALADDWKEQFGGPAPIFFYTMPSTTLAPKITKPQAIHGRNAVVEINNSPAEKTTDNAGWMALIEKAMNEAYK